MDNSVVFIVSGGGVLWLPAAPASVVVADFATNASFIGKAGSFTTNQSGTLIP
jgi:hypothetical protein